MLENKLIVLEVEGGVVHLVKGIPPGVEVEIRDYDVEGATEAQLEELPVDEAGKRYWCTLWTHEETDCPGQIMMFSDD